MCRNYVFVCPKCRRFMDSSVAHCPEATRAIANGKGRPYNCIMSPPENCPTVALCQACKDKVTAEPTFSPLSESYEGDCDEVHSQGEPPLSINDDTNLKDHEMDAMEMDNTVGQRPLTANIGSVPIISGSETTATRRRAPLPGFGVFPVLKQPTNDADAQDPQI